MRLVLSKGGFHVCECEAGSVWAAVGLSMGLGHVIWAGVFYSPGSCGSASMCHPAEKRFRRRRSLVDLAEVGEVGRPL